MTEHTAEDLIEETFRVVRQVSPAPLDKAIRAEQNRAGYPDAHPPRPHVLCIDEVAADAIDRHFNSGFCPTRTAASHQRAPSRPVSNTNRPSRRSSVEMRRDARWSQT